MGGRGRGRGGPGLRGGARKPAASGQLHTHQPHTATTVEVSADRRRALLTSNALDTATLTVPNYHAEDHNTARAMEDPDFSYFLADDGAWLAPPPLPASERDNGDDDGIRMALQTSEVPPELLGNFERWANADFPMQVFIRNTREETLDEMLRGEGRGAERFYRSCARCKSADPLFRCSRQSCFGPAMYCEMCVAQQHRQLPTHMLEKWNGDFFEAVPMNELTVETRVQLGHVPGSFCPKATPAHKDFVVINTLGIRIVKLNFCGCDSTITHRQQLMRACLWPATSLDPQTCATFNAIRLFELLSNNDGLKPTEYCMMEMLKRVGRGQEDSGIKGTGQGELALDCRACPQPKKNLPEGWENINWDDMDEDQRYKYFLILAEDANFKLINRNVSTEERDPVVDDGTGYFCNRADYTAHIRKHVDKEEISSCSGFQAMFLANARRVKGLRVTSVGGVTCARHNMWRPNGIGDLQAGERQSNMDFLFFSAVLNFALMWLILSYDIACQFSKNIWTRMPGRWMVPNFHLPPHKTGCHSAFSFHWLWGAGCTYGETVEQNWEFFNGAAAATKLMGLGARCTALEGLFSFQNWRRLIAHRLILKRRMAEGIKEGRAHKVSFEAFTAGLTVAMPDAVEEWRLWVEKWEKTRHVENEKGSPYEYAEANTTLKDVRVKLAREEYDRTGNGDEVGREETPSTFLLMGMEIEEAQRQLTIDVKAAGPHPTPSQELDVLKRRTQLRARIKAFRKLQQTYMPAVRRYLTRSQRTEWDAGRKEPESTRLFMPSDISTEKLQQKACVRGLDGVEARLREGEAGEALDILRDALRTRTATTRFKVRNWSSQRALTRGQGILRVINVRIHGSKLRYRYTRQALLKLKGHGGWEERWRILTEDDVRGLNERALADEEKSERERLRAAGEMVEEGGIALVGDLVSSETHRTLSWICSSFSVYGEGGAQVGGEGVGAHGDAGDHGANFAGGRRRTYEKLRADWGPIRARAGDYLGGRVISGREEIVVEVDRDSMRWAESLVYEREEIENDMYQ
ncbi:hypothetical protein C8F04DRAFT_1274533 [Mycena alexandri]|uniref:CxC2-like cysteine cluster KDZ transposase-associated domain-containing protein n=1 Tax=Mycena alexandri TaxID=1745969 RepID=A0AAD6WPZ2_9AGAR|nr:hypothetical protein C8F04DRAFT_1274533 [Mycena alexandri]